MSKESTPAPHHNTFTYTFEFADGSTRTFRIVLASDTLQTLPGERESYPEWTRLHHRKCTNCPLDEFRHPRCPIAVNLVDVVDFFGERSSFEEVAVKVEANEREYRKTTTLQQAISSLIGIYTVTSGCPVMDKLRPMVDTHLPFATPREAIYRLVSMYLTAQFFRARAGQAPDWRLAGLPAILDDCRLTNAFLSRRLKSLGIHDATLNALNILNVQGELASLSLETDNLAHWQRIFDQAYCQDG